MLIKSTNTTYSHVSSQRWLLLWSLPLYRRHAKNRYFRNNFRLHRTHLVVTRSARMRPSLRMKLEAECVLIPKFHIQSGCRFLSTESLCVNNRHSALHHMRNHLENATRHNWDVSSQTCKPVNSFSQYWNKEGNCNCLIILHATQGFDSQIVVMTMNVVLQKEPGEHHNPRIITNLWVIREYWRMPLSGSSQGLRWGEARGSVDGLLIPI